MKYNLIGDNNQENILETIFKNRGVEDINSFFDIEDKFEFIHNPYLLKDMDKAVEIIKQAIKVSKERKVVIKIIVDSDLDGYSSAGYIYNYLQRLNKNFELRYYVHENDGGKIHGVFNKDIEDDVDLVIVPDAGTHSKKEIKEIVRRGVPVLVLDHHPADKESDYEELAEIAILVNNQRGDYPNKNLSGVGVVHKLCEALDEELGVNYSKDYLDLVAWGMIADMMPTTDLENRHYMQRGMKNIKNPFLKALYDKVEFTTKGIKSFKTMSWNVAPLVNGTVRFGSLEERKDMFEAFIENNDKTIPYKKRGATETIEQSIYEGMARICTNVKGRQDRARDKVVNNLVMEIEKNGLLDNKILIVEATEELKEGYGSLTGMIASNLANRYKKPTLILNQMKSKKSEEDIIYGGSGRNFNDSPLESFKSMLGSTDLFNFAQGHESAFGIQIPNYNLDKLIKETNDLLEDFNFDGSYNVDFIVKANDLQPINFDIIDAMKNEWGKDFEEPLIAVTDLTVVNPKDIAIMGKKSDTIKIIHNGIEFIKFKCSEEEVMYISSLETSVNIELVGQVGLSEFNGKVSPQIMIKDFNINEKSKEEIDYLDMF